MQLTQSLTRYRETWIEISLDAIKHNVRQFKQFIDPATRLMAVVKADGYGHGAVVAANAALEAGADYLSVALLEEALELRATGIRAPILVLGAIPLSAIRAAIEADISITAINSDMVREAAAQSTALKKPAVLHLKVDTGMSRLGVSSKEEALAIANLARSYAQLRIEGIFTHLAYADGEDPTYSRLQFSRFQETLDYLEEAGHCIEIKHCCNSAGTMNFPEMHLDMVRIGIALYGLYPAETLKISHPIRLKQAFRMLTRISALKRIPGNQPVGYGCTSVSNTERTIAVLPAGYADGISRLLSNRGGVRVRGQAAPIVGRVCMDQTMIDVTGIAECRLGDEVVLIGTEDSGPAALDNIAELMGTINYEVVCLIGGRTPRVFV